MKGLLPIPIIIGAVNGKMKASIQPTKIRTGTIALAEIHLSDFQHLKILAYKQVTRYIINTVKKGCPKVEGIGTIDDITEKNWRVKAVAIKGINIGTQSITDILSYEKEKKKKSKLKNSTISVKYNNEQKKIKGYAQKRDG